MRQSRYAPRTILLLVSSFLIVGLTFEIMKFVWVGNKSLELVDRELIREEKQFLAVIQMSEDRKFSRSETEGALSRYYLLSAMKGYTIILQDNRPLFRSPNLEPGVTFESMIKDQSPKVLTTSLGQSEPVRMLSKTEGSYKFVLGLSLKDEEILQRGIYSFLDLLVSVFLFLLVGAGLLFIFILHRPMRAMQQYVKTLAERPKNLPLPQIPGIITRDVNDLINQIYVVVEELHRSKDQALEFSSMASHELRTPLSIIRNQLETALSSKLSAVQLRKMIGSVYDEMLRLNGTIEDLLNLSTLQAGTFKLTIETFALDHFLKEFYDEALFLTRPNNITVVLKKCPHIVIQADHSRLRQVLFNLLDNSIKNTRSGGRIRISYNLSGNDVLMTFADTGRGIPHENIGKIFEPFFKDNAEKSDSRGTGLGLTLVKWIIETHQGKVSVESQPGKGTAFYIRLPRFQPPQ
jgi:signal transduction histidine kinase